MTREEFLTMRIKSLGSVKEFSTKINMPYTTLRSILTNVGGASIDNVVKICNGLGISTATLEGLDEEIPVFPSFEYTYIPVGISAGQMEDCEALSLLPKISVPDVIMGPYARDPHIVFMRVNGESMNRVIDNGATIAVMTGLERCQIQNGDIVIARYDGAGYTIKRYYDLPEKHQIILTPDSDDPGFLPIPINYESPDDLRIFGRVVMYSVIL